MPAFRNDSEQLLLVRLATPLQRGGCAARLFSNPLGEACYWLDKKKTLSCLTEMKHCGLLEPGLVFSSEVRPMTEDRNLSPMEWRQFQCEVGCPPLLITCLGCGRALEIIRHASGLKVDSSLTEKEKDVQVNAVEVMRLLVDYGAKINMIDVGPLGNTALHVAAHIGAPHIVSSLLRMDADVRAHNRDGNTPELVARQRGNITCDQILQVAAMIASEKQEAIIKDLEEDTSKVTERRKKVKERRRRKKNRQKEARPAHGAGSGSDEESGQESAPASEGQESGKEAGRVKRVEFQLEEKDDGGDEEDRGRASRQGAAAENGDKSQPQHVSYGRDGYWSRLDENYYPDDWLDDLDLPDEWDVEKWGKYEDWVEDWDKDETDLGTSDSDAASGDDDDEVRAEVSRLRKEKASYLQQLYDIAAEREERSHEAEQIERQTMRLDERAKRLEERQSRVKAGDTTAVDDTAAEVEVSAWWEERATVHARTVWELEKEIAQQQEEHQKEAGVLEKELRAIRRKTKGLEYYWDHFFDAQTANEILDRIAAEQQFLRLADEISRLTAFLEISPALKAQLPPLLVPGPEEGPVMMLPPADELMVAVQVHDRIQAFRREQKVFLNQLVDFCNKQLSAKDEEILMAVEHELKRALPEMEDEYNLEAWSRLAELAAYARQDLERISRTSSSRDITGARGSSELSPAMLAHRSGATPRSRNRGGP